MELKDDLQGKHVYLDAGVLIYLLDGFESSQALSDLKELLSKNEIKVSVSIMAYGEIALFGTEENLEQIINFVRAFNPLEISNDATISAGIFRGENEMSVASAINLMVALENKCDVFLTNDSTMIVPENIKLALFSDYENTLDKKLIL